MEVIGLRRTQSLRSLSWVQERSWGTPGPTHWDRKSVSQLVQHYQSCGDLRSVEKEEHKFQTSDRLSEEGWRGPEGREKAFLGGFSRALSLSRSHSMDYLPQKETSATRTLCALFESKCKQQKLSSGALLSSSPASASNAKRGRDCPLQDGRSHDTSSQRVTQAEGGRTSNGLPASSNRLSRYSYGVTLALTVVTVTRTVAL
ncbi:uncharacterized protein LOC129177219 [Dunckerocampus dactyliophorus]|uniref:uncharacterized protein LOC129177219 n=1 Tax=Dunckerocampus dactyliophorus TaxID=161453 RepID=UPI0024077605|nr:uncharacterized protein LOC129177219 [Dunckerocampus dactyliophorus]